MLSDRKSQEVLTNDDLDQISQLISEKVDRKDDGSEWINYMNYCWVASKLPLKCQKYFKPSIYLRLRHDDQGRIDSRQFFSFILRRASLVQERVCISVYDEDGDGFLSEEDLTKYLGDLASAFPQLEKLESGFMPFYMCHCVRKFFFALDTARKNRVAIKDVLLSPILSEFFELQQPQVPIHLLATNWFSLPTAMKVYGQYVELDVDRNGMLRPQELYRFAGSRYSKAFLRRVYQEYQTFSGELDYKNYLDFVLAVNDIQSASGLAYVFRLLDIKQQNYLDEFSMMYFLKDLAPRVMGGLNIPELLIELIDMAGPKDPKRVTLQDLTKCGVGGTIVSLLIDVQALTQNQFKE